MKKNICSICGKEYQGFGNNAQPVNNGRCCDKCNSNAVIPARLLIIFNRNSTRIENHQGE